MDIKRQTKNQGITKNVSDFADLLRMPQILVLIYVHPGDAQTYMIRPY